MDYEIAAVGEQQITKGNGECSEKKAEYHFDMFLALIRIHGTGFVALELKRILVKTAHRIPTYARTNA